MSQSPLNVSCAVNSTLSSNGTVQNNTCNPNPGPRQSIVGFPTLSTEARILLIFIYCLIFVLGFLGNALVLYVISRKKELAGGDHFMLSLAVADLLAAIFVPLLVIHDMLSEVKWQLGEVMCKFLPSVSPITLAASSWSLMFIAADRYRVIVTPMKPRISAKVKYAGIALLWVIAVTLPMPYALAQHLHLGYCIEDGQFMSPEFKDAYVITWVSVGWVMPLIIISILYGICAANLRRGMFTEDSNTTTRKRYAENVKVMKLFVLIVILFGICTLPYAIYFATIHYVIRFMRSKANFELIWTLNYVLFAFSTANSCMNPFVYARKQKDVNAFIRRICCKAPLSRQQNNTLSTSLGQEESISRKKYASQSRVRSKSNKISKEGIEQEFTNNAFCEKE